MQLISVVHIMYTCAGKIGSSMFSKPNKTTTSSYKVVHRPSISIHQEIMAIAVNAIRFISKLLKSPLQPTQISHPAQEHQTSPNHHLL